MQPLLTPPPASCTIHAYVEDSGLLHYVAFLLILMLNSGFSCINTKLLTHPDFSLAGFGNASEIGIHKSQFTGTAVTNGKKTRKSEQLKIIASLWEPFTIYQWSRYLQAKGYQVCWTSNCYRDNNRELPDCEHRACFCTMDYLNPMLHIRRPSISINHLGNNVDHSPSWKR